MTTAPEVATAVAAEGLTRAEAARRLATDGPNRMPEPARRAWWRDLVDQLTHFFARLLWVAASLAFVAGMPQLGVAIIVVVVVNGVFAYWQEARAERAAARLRDLLPRRARVVRDGEVVEVAADELVIGDLVLLADGDRVSADLDVVRAESLTVDTSMLTGESVPAVIAEGERLHAGTFVTEGDAAAVVVATGAHTRLAELARLTTEGERRPTPLALEIGRVVRIVAAMALAVGVAFFALALLVGETARDGFLFGIGVTVALVPEGLLPTVTLSLAIGAQRMASRRALVRRLESVETLGSTTFICSDKTGTLTRNEMTVAAVWTPAGEATPRGEGYRPPAQVDITAAADGAMAEVRDVVAGAWWCSTGRVAERDGAWVAVGDPMEAAVDALARGLDLDLDEARVVARHPFDPHRRRMSVVVAGEGGARVLEVKGAPESVIARCRDVPSDVAGVLDRLAHTGLRVLAVASRDVTDARVDASSADDLEQQLELRGLLGFADPPRAGTAEAIAQCRAAGIRIAMLTGDHPVTAAAIADRIGLRRHDDPVVDGAHLPTDDGALGALVDHDGVVIARVAPEDKLRIARSLQERGHVVAMTGDGVNDGPALHTADIGVAMGRGGTDVAREAADLVLLDDEFGTIVAAVDQGRATFANVRRFLTYHLTDNVAELTPFVCWALSAGRFPLAIGVLQVLCLDIGTDLLPALALGAERTHPGVGDGLASIDGAARPGAPAVTPGGAARPGAPAVTPGGARRHLLDPVVLRRALLVLGPTEAVMAMAAFVASMAGSGWRPGDAFPGGGALETASGAAFAAVVVGQMANAFACRSSWQSPWRIGWGSNRLLVGAVLSELALLSVFLYLTPLADVLGQRGPSWWGGGVALLAAPAVLAADALDKWRRRITRARRRAPRLL